MACALCRLEKPLRNSHVIPEFAYKPVYDEKHRALRVNRHDSALPRIQKGHRERLLCDACEQRVGRFETYFADVWYQQRALPEKVPGRYFRISGLDYGLFQLFQLSVLWRCSIAREGSFRHCTLGPHEEILRRNLLNEVVVPPDVYPIFGVLIRTDDREVLHRLVMPPAESRFDGIRTHCVGFGGCVWYFPVARHRGEPLPPSLRLREDGSIYLPVIDDLEFSLFRNFFRDRRLAEEAATP